MENYSVRKWLNEEGSSSTGSVVAFKGKANWGFKDEPASTSFLEVADCTQKVRLHQSRYDSNKDFLNKMIKLKVVLDDFIEHLEKTVDEENK